MKFYRSPVPIYVQTAAKDLPKGYYILQDIIDRRDSGKGFLEYLALWVGGAETWEPLHNFKEVGYMVERYETSAGIEKNPKVKVVCKNSLTHEV